MAPRVLVVQRGPLDVDGIEQSVAADGEAALGLLAADTFDALVVDLALAPLDGWCVLAGIGSRTLRPRVIAAVGTAADRDRARRLGATVYVSDWAATGAVVLENLAGHSG